MRFNLIELEGQINWPWKHLCKYKPIAVNHVVDKEERGIFGNSPGGPHTLILKKCKCGDTKVEKVRGHWNKEQVCNIQEKIDVDLMLSNMEEWKNG